MNFHPLIQKIIACALLLIFTISVTPKKYLHDAFTHRHTDEIFVVSQAKEKAITTYHYNCGFVNVEATSPFIAAFLSIQFYQTQYGRGFVETLANSYKSLTSLPFSLRGPPAA